MTLQRAVRQLVQLGLSERRQVPSAAGLLQAQIRERVGPRVKAIVDRVAEHRADYPDVGLGSAEGPRPSRRLVYVA